LLASLKQRLGRREDEGFTLIELMVVLLIIAILLAIAIPTFLGARNTANARSTQENLRNALTAEQTNWTNTQAFATGLGNIEPSLNWTTGTITASGGNTVSVNASSTGVVLVGYAKDGNCYAIAQSNGPTTSATFTDYAAWTAPSSGCAQPTPPSAAGTAPGDGTVQSAAPTGNANWYTSF
jgi:type IV pilus assembly protein PilA